MDSFVPIVAFLLAGMALPRIRGVPDRTGNALNLVVIYVCLPALILLNIPRLAISGEILVPALMPWAMVALSVALVLLLSNMLRWERAVTGCLLLMVPLGNTSFLGLPMVKAFFGEEAIPYALLYDQLGSFPLLALYGTLIVSMYGAGEDGPTFLSVGKKVITFPPFIALLAALALGGVSYPAAVAGVLAILSSALVPLAMAAVGFQMNLRMGKEQAGLLALGLSIKMAVAPLAALAICGMLGLEGDAARVSVFEAGMPPMVLAGALAGAANLSPALAAALVGVGIAASFLTLPVLYLILP